MSMTAPISCIPKCCGCLLGEDFFSRPDNINPHPVEENSPLEWLNPSAHWFTQYGNAHTTFSNSHLICNYDLTLKNYYRLIVYIIPSADNNESFIGFDLIDENNGYFLRFTHRGSNSPLCELFRRTGGVDTKIGEIA